MFIEEYIYIYIYKGGSDENIVQIRKHENTYVTCDFPLESHVITSDLGRGLSRLITCDFTLKSKSRDIGVLVFSDHVLV